ncbi:MAG TPA: MFS transporter [Acidimicrobiales bacterium]|nr:MFS transporter [Acidimicrobiales bacterium]
MSSFTLDGARADAYQGRDRRWWVLAVLAIAQLMIIVDASIVNIALPSAQKALHISTADRQWVVTAYTLAFGGLLLLGGRVADYMGRKRVLLIGLLGFAGASAIGGFAPDATLLFAARALQGGFAALMAPAALSLINVTFTEPHERARAFGVYGAISGGGLALGLIAGGLLTQFASWRWCLLVNVPIALAAGLAGSRLIPESRMSGRTRYDLPGAVTATAGMAMLVYAVTRASTGGWSAPLTLALLGVAVALLVSFVVAERRSPQPMLPLRVITDRVRGGSFLATLLVGVGMMGTFLFLTFYLQQTLHYSALKTGFAYLPFSLGIVTAAAVATKAATRVAPRALMGIGLGMAIVGMLMFSQVGVHTAYWDHLFPAELIMSLGMGLVFVPINSTALAGVAAADSGVASALINTSQQVGGSVGTALLNTIFTTASTSYAASHLSLGNRVLQLATIHGYSVAFLVAAGFLGLALVGTVTLINARAVGSPDQRPEDDGLPIEELAPALA